MKWLGLVVCVVLLVALVKASPYNKYGRTCRDILCIAGQEECVMENDACTGYSTDCGRYPTCKRKVQKKGCASMRCDPGHFCSIRQENCARPPCEIKPVCIPFRTSATSSSTNTAVNRQSYDNSYRGYGGTGQRTGSYGNFGNIGKTWGWGSG